MKLLTSSESLWRPLPTNKKCSVASAGTAAHKAGDQAELRSYRGQQSKYSSPQPTLHFPSCCCPQQYAKSLVWLGVLGPVLCSKTLPMCSNLRERTSSVSFACVRKRSKAMSAPHVPAVTSQAIRFRSASMTGQIFHVHVRAIVEKPFLVTLQLGISCIIDVLPHLAYCRHPLGPPLGMYRPCSLPSSSLAMSSPNPQSQ